MSRVQVAQNFREALQVQVRVNWALMLRETKTMYGRSKFGYLWVVIQTAFGVAVFWGLRVAMGAHESYGLALPVYLLSGMTAWNVFFESVQKIGPAIDANQALLYYSKVRYFDIIVSRSLLVGATNFFVLLVLTLGIRLAGINVRVVDAWPFILSWFFLIAMGTGLGALCCGLKRYAESVLVIVSMILRVVFFVSGAIFSLNMVPARLSFVATCNPIYQLIEYSRTSFSYAYHFNGLDVTLVVFTALVMIFTGLMVELLTRKKVDVV